MFITFGLGRRVGVAFGSHPLNLSALSLLTCQGTEFDLKEEKQKVKMNLYDTRNSPSVRISHRTMPNDHLPMVCSE